MKTTTADSLLCRLTGSMVAVHWLPVNQRFNGPTLNDVCVFGWALPDAGLPFQARTREDRATLDDLRRRGLVDVQGQTSGIHVRLTPAGASATWDLSKAVKTVATIASMPTVTPPGGGPVVMGYELCPAAGDWWATARATDKAWSAYLDELQATMTALMPLFVMGWARQFVSGDQMAWAVTVTDAGRQAMTATMPPEPNGFQFDADAFMAGREESKRRYTQSPPDAGSEVARTLPCSRWY